MTPRESNTLGKASLLLTVPAICFVFCVGLCTGIGKEQGWLAQAGLLLFVFGATFAFVGLIGAVLGVGGLFGRNRSKATAVVGLILGLLTVILFLAVLNAAKP